MMVTSQTASNQTAWLHQSLRTKALALNAVWNILGQGCYLLIALFAIPVLVRSLGSQRFGLLTLVWALIGSFTLFDLGLGRAITKFVAEGLALGHIGECCGLVWPALFLMAALGFSGAVLLLLLARPLVYSVLHLPPALGREAARSLLPIALSVPLTMVTTGLRGILEARHEFGALNAVRLFTTIVNFGGPLIVVTFSVDLFAIVMVLLVGRVVAFVIHLILSFRVFPELRSVTLHWRSLGPVIKLGGWINLSNVISPVLVYLDRFVVGYVLSVAAVAFYTTPFEMITKLWLLPVALVGVMYPAFSATAILDPERVSVLFQKSVKSLLIVLFPVLLLVVVFAPELLQAWLGGDFARNSARVLQWMAAGVFLNSLAQVPYALLQAGGRADLPAKLHMVELAVYIPAIFFMTRAYGIQGTAIVWAVRLGIESILLFLIGSRHVGGAVLGKLPLSMAAIAVALMGTGALLHGLQSKLAFSVVVPAAFIYVCLMVAFSPEERAQLRAVLSRATVLP